MVQSIPKHSRPASFICQNCKFCVRCVTDTKKSFCRKHPREKFEGDGCCDDFKMSSDIIFPELKKEENPDKEVLKDFGPVPAEGAV